MRDGRDTAGINHHSRKRRGGQNGLDSALVYSLDVSANHLSHNLPRRRCSFSGCPTYLAWPKVKRIKEGKAEPRDYYCYLHKEEAKKI